MFLQERRLVKFGLGMTKPNYLDLCYLLRNWESRRSRTQISSKMMPPYCRVPIWLFLADNATLLRYLRGCKFDVPRTQAKLEMYYTCKTAMPGMFTGRDPFDPSVATILRLGLVKVGFGLVLRSDN